MKEFLANENKKLWSYIYHMFRTIFSFFNKIKSVSCVNGPKGRNIFVFARSFILDRNKAVMHGMFEVPKLQNHFCLLN